MPYYLVVTPFFPSGSNWRGPFVYDQVRAIQRLRPQYKVVVFKPSKTNGIFQKHFNGISTVTFPIRENPSYLFNGFFNDYNSRLFLMAINTAGINPSDVVAVHCHSAVFGVCGLSLKKINPNVTTILQHHDRDPYKILNGKLASWVPNLRYRAKKSINIFNEVDCHIVISDIVKDNLLSFPSPGNEEHYAPYISQCQKASRLDLPKVNIKRVEKLYNGVNLDIFHPLHHDEAGDSCFTIGYIANFIGLKRHIDLIKAVEILAGKTLPIKLKLIGSGPEKNNCLDYVQTHGLSSYVEFIDEMHHENLCAFYNSLDLFVFPSAYDGFGCVATEAAACGVPFISAEGNGCCEYIAPEEKSRWTYNVGDVDSLAGKIESVFRDKTNKQQQLQYPLDINILTADFLNRIGL